MSKATPGPWKFNGKSQSGKQSYNVVGTRLGYKYKVARCPFNDEYDEKEAEANAKLIAAAPEMAELLEEFINEFEVDDMNTEYEMNLFFKAHKLLNHFNPIR